MASRMSTTFPPLTLAQIKSATTISPPPPPPPIPTPETLVTLTPPTSKASEVDDPSADLETPESMAEKHERQQLQQQQLLVSEGSVSVGGRAETAGLHPLRSGLSSSAMGGGKTSKKRERWLVTRKTWRYMADAGKLLIPEMLRKGKDLKDYSREDMEQLDETFQRACDQLQEFVVWEGPIEDPRILLARNRMDTGAQLIAASLDKFGKQQFHLEDPDEEDETGGKVGKDGKRRKASNRNSLSGQTGQDGSVNTKAAALLQQQRRQQQQQQQLQQGQQQLQPGNQFQHNQQFHQQSHDSQQLQQSASATDKHNLMGGGGGGGGGSAGGFGSVLGGGGGGAVAAAAAAANRRGRSISAVQPPGAQGAIGQKGLRPVQRRSSSGKRRMSTARMPSFSGFGPGVSSGRNAGPAFDGKLGKVENEKGGFFPSPYGTGMLPQHDYQFDPAFAEAAAEGGGSGVGSGSATGSTAGGGGGRGSVASGDGSGGGSDGDRRRIMGSRGDGTPTTSSAYLQQRLRVMLPVGEKAPAGFTQVGRRSLPLGDLPQYNPPSRDSYFQLPGSDILLEELPPSYASDTDREWFSSRRTSSSAADSGVLSPGSQDEMIPQEQNIFDNRSFLERLHHAPSIDERRLQQAESGIGSGSDSIGAVSLENRKISVTVQTEPLPEEFFKLQEEERRRKEEEERLIREAEERAKKEEEEMEAAVMGDSVMRYLKMVRRNSKTADHKKADRFRSMNYDPTLRNIKAKYLHSEDLIRGIKHAEIQAGDTLVSLLKRCETLVDPTPDSVCSVRKLSQAVSDFSDSIVGSPSRRLSLPFPDEPLVPLHGEQRDFFSSLYSGEMPAAMEASAVPEDYYNYLESWYRSQKGLHPPMTPVTTTAAAATPPPPASITSASTGNIPRTVSATSISSTTSLGTSSLAGQSTQHTGIFIPVTALQNLRASMPSLTSAASTSSNVSRSTSSLGKSPSFLSSVISKPFGLGNLSSQSGGGTGRILTKKLWRGRSKSQSRPSVAGSLWTPQQNCRWMHISNRVVALESTHLLLLHELERVALQKLALQKLNKSDLGTTIRIPKDSSEKSDSKSKRRGYLLKKKVLQKKEKEPSQKTSSVGTNTTTASSSATSSSQPPQPVFGIPLAQCVEHPPRKRSTISDAPNPEELHSPSGSSTLGVTTPPSVGAQSHTGRVGSRTSVGSIADMVGRSDRISSPIHSVGSCESLNNLEMQRRSSVGHSQSSALDAMSFASCLEDAVSRMAASASAAPDSILAPSSGLPNVPPIVLTCIRHLEQHGLRTVGIFRVSSSKKRVRQLREDFDNGAEIAFSEDIAVHDVATLLKEFFRDLPDPLVPKELIPGLLAIHKLSSSQDQTLALQRLMELLPTVNRDTLFVLLHFLGLVADNAEDRKLPDGSTEPGNKMDATNLATLFAPNLLHTFADDVAAAASSSTSQKVAAGFAPAAIMGSTSKSNQQQQTPDLRMEYVSALRMLIDKREAIFEIAPEELHDVYLSFYEACPQMLDALLRRRCVMAGNEFVEEEEELYENVGDRCGSLLPESNVLFHRWLDMADSVSTSRDASRIRYYNPCREESEGSEGAGSTGSSWMARPRDRSEHSDSSEIGTSGRGRGWGGLRQRHRDGSRGGEGRPPSADSSTGGSNLRFSVPARSTDGSKETPPIISSPPPPKTASVFATCTSPTAVISQQHPQQQQQQQRQAAPRRNAESGRSVFDSSVVCSPAASSSARATPSSEMFFGSGNTTPSFMASPPPHQSGFNSPMFSPPISPQPLQQQQQQQQQQHRQRRSLQHVSSPSQDRLVLQPVPQGAKKLTSEAESTRSRSTRSRSSVTTATPSPSPSSSTVVGGSNEVDLRVCEATPVMSPTQVASPEPLLFSSLNPKSSAGGGGHILHTLPEAPSSEDVTSTTSSLNLNRPTTGSNKHLGSTSSIRHSASTPNSRLSSPYLEARSKTENLDRLISDLDREEREGGGGGGSTAATREMKKYVRRRYTDSRHPASREEVPDGTSPQYPPIRKKAKASSSTTDETTSKRNANNQ